MSAFAGSTENGRVGGGPARRSMRRAAGAALLLAAAVLALAPAPAGAFGKNKVHYDSFDWQVYHSPHFDLYYYPEEEVLASQAILLAEEVYERLVERLGHRPRKRIPLVLYSAHPFFQQTNVIPDLIGEGTQGFTDIYRSRVVLPYDGSVADFRHVVAHELVHVFQLDILFGGSGPEHAMSSMGQFQSPPLWFMEGGAEWFSTGWDAEAQLYIEDAVANEYLQPLDRDFGGYLVYKQGQAAMAFLSRRFGDGILPELFKAMAGRGGLARALKRRTGLDLADLDEEFQRDLKARTWSKLARRPAASERAFPLLEHADSGRLFYHSPAFSPDGERLAYFSDHEGEVNLYLASALDGKVLRKLVTGHRSGRLESLHPFDTSASFSPDGTRLALVVLSGGRDELMIVDAENGREIARHRPALDTMRSPALSPDGASLAVSGVADGVTDLYLFEVATESWRRLTEDLADEQDPAWLDAETLVFARHRELVPGRFAYPGGFAPTFLDVDEFGTYPEILDAGEGYDLWRLRLGGEASPLAATAGDDRHPLPAPGGGLLFTSDAGGLVELWYRAAPDSAPRRVYAPAGGVISPALSPDGRRLAFSSFNDGGYDVLVLEELDGLLGSVDARTADGDPAVRRYQPFGIEPESRDFVAAPAPPAVPDSLTGRGGPYKTRYLVDGVGRVVTYDTVYGFYGSSYLTFKDVLGDKEIDVMADIFGQITDSNLLLSFTSRARRLNWSAGAYSFLSYYQSGVGTFGEYFPNARIYLEWRRGAFVAGSYPFTLFTRLDGDLHVVTAKRKYYDGVDAFGYAVPTPDPDNPDEQLEERRTIVQPSVSLVHDDALFDYLGPVKGSRWLLSAAYAHDLGGEIATDRWVGIADYRRYFYGPGGHSLALRLSARGSTGVDPVTFYMGGPQDLRGYEYLEFDGTRAVMASLEWRFPFINLVWFGGPLPFVWGGIGGAFFADLGGAWYGDDFVPFRHGTGDVQLQDLRGDIGYGLRMRMGYFLLMWDFAWPTDMQTLGERQVHFSVGAQF